MRKIFFYLLFFLTGYTAKADTIQVDSVKYLPPITVALPYSIDSLDTKGKQFEYNSILEMNHALVHQLRKSQETLSLPSSMHLFDSCKNEFGITGFHFTIDTEYFQKIQLHIKKLENYNLFVDGIKNNGSEITLEPGRTEFDILCVVSDNNNDSLEISVVSDSIHCLVVNATSPKPYSMRDLLLGDHYRSVQLSPSGKYLVTTYYTTTSKGENMFRTVVTETNSQNVLMKFPNYVDFKWLPNRDLLFITRKGFNGYELVTINPVTKDEQILASNLPSQNFTISPNEKYLIYYQTEEGVAIKNGIKRLTEPDDRMPGWRNSRYLSLYDLSSGINRRLTFGTTSAFLNDISPDGNELLISFNRSETNRTPFERTTFVKMNVLTGKVDTLLHDQMFLSSAKFSPDASSLLVKASPGAFDGIGSELTNGQIANAFDYRLYLYSCDDKKVTPLLLHFNSSVSSYQWDKLSNKIFFKATEGCNEKIYSLDPENMFVLEYDLPVSYVQDYSISTTSKNTQIVFFGQTGERAREMFTGILGNQSKIKVNPIGEINFDNLNRHVSIGSCYDWSFLSSRGDSIRGFYFLPPHFNENNQYPLIVYYYGGCTPTPKLLEFQYPLQVLASMGYVVYVCQPSGAIGFGQEFAARHVNTWGEGSANDIIEGTKKFIQSHSFINKNKIGCMGASYGGFMTQYLQTKTDIFTAAISHAGISNIASYWGGGYWGYTYGEIAQYGSFPWNNPDLYVKQSPLFNADKINTPLLLLHGTVDTNVPTNESQQLFTALRILGKPVSYVQIEGQDHVIVDFNKRLLWQKTIFAWFNYWLKDEHAWWEELYPNDKFGLN